jgi:hypothetical protein
MHLDMTISFGNVLTIATFIAGGFIAYGKLKERLVAIETQLAPIWKDYTEGRFVWRHEETRE